MTTDLDQAHAAVSDFGELEAGPGGISRRKFMGYLLAGPVLIAGARMIDPSAAQAAAPGVDPTTQLPVDVFDLSDLLALSCQPTNSLLTVSVMPDGTAVFELPRAEVGQGLTTSVAVIIADEIGLPMSQVSVVLRDADPQLVWNQLTGGSNSIHSMYATIRMASATARTQLSHAAAAAHGGLPADYSIVDGIVNGRGVSVPVASLAAAAAVTETKTLQVELKPDAQLTMIGTRVSRVDARDIVTGVKQFAMDLQIPNALPTMICRAPDINGVVQSLNNKAQIEAMPGVTDVVVINPIKFVQGGVAVRAATFGQCIDAIRAMNVTWAPGSTAGRSASDVANDLAKAEIPIGQPPAGAQVVDQVFTFNFRPGDPLETNCAVADVRPGSAEIWAALKSPIWAQEQIAIELGMTTKAVTVHVTQGGGSFGRHLFCDAAFEAALVSGKLAKPVKLMWHRTDNFRQGRVHPMTRSHVRVAYNNNEVVAFDQRHTGVPTDFSQGFGEVLSANGATIPGVGLVGYSIGAIFTLSANVPYNFGPVTQLLNEVYNYNTFNTSSVRNVYSPDVCTATELMVDQVAAKLGLDPVAMRQKFIRDDRVLAVLNAAASAGNWGRAMAPGTAQGIAVHKEYKGAACVLVEIDCTPATVNRKIKNGFGGPRVTKVVLAQDYGTPINISGLEAQMMGGCMDGIAQALTYSLHLENGHYLEGSWDNAHYTRQWNTPFEMEFIVMPPNGNPPGGAGEASCGVSMAATACAYARATGTLPTTFPINYNEPLGFSPFPTSPPFPQSPTNGLRYLGKPLEVTPQS